MWVYTLVLNLVHNWYSYFIPVEQVNPEDKKCESDCRKDKNECEDNATTVSHQTWYECFNVSHGSLILHTFYFQDEERDVCRKEEKDCKDDCEDDCKDDCDKWWDGRK